MKKVVDVAVVGGGLVGLALCCLLGRKGLRVAMIEKSCLDYLPLSEEPSLRVSAINTAGQQLFREVGVWDEMYNSSRVSPFENMYVWDSVGRGEIHFNCTEIAASELGYIIENPIIHNALLKEISCHANISILANHAPIALNHGQKHIELICTEIGANTEQTICAELLVGADGANSWVRAQTNIATYLAQCLTH